MVVKVRFFGALKKFGSDGLVLDVPTRCEVKDLREFIKKRLSDDFQCGFNGELVDRAAIATESRVLQNSEVIGGEGTFSLLPPVCGG